MNWKLVFQLSMMLLTGPVIGVISGLVLGLFAFIASRLVRRRAAVAR